MHEDHEVGDIRPPRGVEDESPAKPTHPSRLRLKESCGWFPAGACVRKARNILSDGAFKLYVSISLDAAASTGRFETTHNELATLLRKSKRSIGVYVREIEEKAVCRVQPASNQHGRTVFEVCDEYWPYDRSADTPDHHERMGDAEQIYVSRIRKYFQSLGCTNSSFTSPDERFARELNKRGVAIETVENALLTAAVRKYNSWLTKGASPPIATLRYVESVIEEIQQQPWPSGYREYLEMKLGQLELRWRQQSGNGGHPTAPPRHTPAGAKK